MIISAGGEKKYGWPKITVICIAGRCNLSMFDLVEEFSNHF